MAEQSEVTDHVTKSMRRRRSFVASATSKAASAVTVPPPTEDDGLPVLTEILSPEASISENAVDRFNETQLSVLTSDIAHSIGQELAHKLPKLLEIVLLNAGKDLRTGITETMETALRDYIARRKQLRLPLEDKKIP